MSEELVVPTVHRNGTSRESLIDQLCEVSSRLDSACDAMRQAGPNGRDYYVQGPKALGEAIKQHEDRMRRIEAVKKEIDALAMAVCDQD